MVLGGLWHGAAWNFVLWGFYQGGLLCFYKAATPLFMRSSIQKFHKASWALSLVVFFLFTMYGWLLFRAESMTQIMTFTTLIFTDLTMNVVVFVG